MAAKSGESRTGLVVFLVLFILLSIGLGVTTYLEWDGQKALESKAQEADKKAKDWNTDANYWKFLALTYRAYIGLPETKDDQKLVAEWRKQYVTGTGDMPKARDDFRDDHKKAITERWGDQTPMKWDPTIGKPSQTYQATIDELERKLAATNKAATDATAREAAANAAAEARARELEAAKKEYADNLTKLRKDNDTESQALRNTIAEQQKKLDKQGEEAPNALKPVLTEVAELRKTKQDLEKKLKAAYKTIDERRDELAAKQSAQELDISKIAPENLARITSISGTGDQPYISLGSADNLKRSVTFSIYGKGVDGRPLRDSKGKLEVSRITGEHTAQARITELKDERRDPVLPGDFIYNPAWNPNLKQHVAIVGTIDLTGEGRDNIQEFMRTLQNQNVEVDAYLDMKTLKLKKPNGDVGDITRQTDMLILGAGPNFGGRPIKAGDAAGEAKDAILKAMQDATTQAEKLGVRIVRLNNYLETSGYAMPKSLGSEKGKIGFQRKLDAAGSPVERKPQPQQPMK
jgi:hypothetical protein